MNGEHYLIISNSLSHHSYEAHMYNNGISFVDIDNIGVKDFTIRCSRGLVLPAGQHVCKIQLNEYVNTCICANFYITVGPSVRSGLSDN